MTRRQGLRRWAGGFSIAALLVVTLAFASAPATVAAMSSGSELSPRLAELARPAVYSQSHSGQAATLSVAPDGPGSLLRDGNRVVIDVRFDRGAGAGIDDLRAAGAKVLNVSRRYQTVTVAARPTELRKVAAVPRVGGVTEVLAPVVSAAGCSGLATSEGDAQLSAAAARSAFGVDGSGVTVGILSDSFDTATLTADGNGPVATHAANDVASGDLPGPGNPCGHTTPVNVLDDSEANGTDEGRAMAQIVHDLAPGAKLEFATATASQSQFGFAENIRALRNAGADVIADDVFYLEEPFFQDGPVAVAVNEAAASGAAYFSAVGNNNLIDAEGHDIASWEAPEFRDGGSCPTGSPAYAIHCMDFDPGAAVDPAFGITVEPKRTLVVDLQWAQPWFNVDTDLDAYLLDEGTLVGESEFPNADALDQEPSEILSWTNPFSEEKTIDLAINRCDETCGTARALAHPGELEGTVGGDSGTPLLKFALIENGRGVSETEYPSSSPGPEGDTVGPTIFGHSAAAGAVGLGAVRYNTTSAPEKFSSRGPATHYFGPVTGTTPASPIPKQTISKPDVAATDCGATTFFAQLEGGAWRFCGTSAAAPHAAAVAALMREANPSLSPTQIRAALAASAQPVGAFGPDAVGAGLLDAYGAVSSTALPPKISITEPPQALSRNRRPSIGFAANRPVTFECSIDGGTFQSCVSPFVPAAPLLDGEHGFAVTGTDLAGRTGTSGIVSFKIDTRPPRTILRRHPPKTVRTRHRRARVVFSYRSNESDVTFVCRVDGGLPRFCGKKLVRRFRIGRHAFRVEARDAAGNVDRTPVIYRFRVKRVG